jgi:hypothetical protein
VLESFVYKIFFSEGVFNKEQLDLYREYMMEYQRYCRLDAGLFERYLIIYLQGKVFSTWLEFDLIGLGDDRVNRFVVGYARTVSMMVPKEERERVIGELVSCIG